MSKVPETKRQLAIARLKKLKAEKNKLRKFNRFLCPISMAELEKMAERINNKKENLAIGSKITQSLLMRKAIHEFLQREKKKYNL